MTRTDAYIDTSALAKWYVVEAQSDAITEYLRRHGPVAISNLTLVEFRSVMARKRANGDLSPAKESMVNASFLNDIASSFLVERDISRRTYEAAAQLVNGYCEMGLFSLDAIHLAVAQEMGARTLVSADRKLSTVAMEVGMEIAWFGPSEVKLS